MFEQGQNIEANQITSSPDLSLNALISEVVKQFPFGGILLTDLAMVLMSAPESSISFLTEIQRNIQLSQSDQRTPIVQLCSNTSISLTSYFQVIFASHMQTLAQKKYMSLSLISLFSLPGEMFVPSEGSDNGSVGNIEIMKNIIVKSLEICAGLEQDVNNISEKNKKTRQENLLKKIVFSERNKLKLQTKMQNNTNTQMRFDTDKAPKFNNANDVQNFWKNEDGPPELKEEDFPINESKVDRDGDVIMDDEHEIDNQQQQGFDDDNEDDDEEDDAENDDELFKTQNDPKTVYEMYMKTLHGKNKDKNKDEIDEGYDQGKYDSDVCGDNDGNGFITLFDDDFDDDEDEDDQNVEYPPSVEELQNASILLQQQNNIISPHRIEIFDDIMYAGQLWTRFCQHPQLCALFEQASTQISPDASNAIRVILAEAQRRTQPTNQ
ncbi:MAG: hypothetical protein EZS28_001311 [Streblomastix strix]|uniref:Uncharacterized protein n=1 Tax=Streblomastix strix TaxID=222440 RepID=A0A5J4X7H5_9EUKA|nr:MAG: hypothetical protein EZS28_001311 [Streblomastix strix]